MKNPINWIKLFLERKNEYDKYLEKGDFSDESFYNLIEKADKSYKFIQDIVNILKKIPLKKETADYIIEFQKNVGFYRLKIFTNIDVSKYSWLNDYICQLFDVKLQRNKDDTFFIKDYNTDIHFRLNNLFDFDKKTDYETYMKYNVIPTIEEIEKDAMFLIKKINIFLKIIDSIFNKIKGAELLDEYYKNKS